MASVALTSADDGRRVPVELDDTIVVELDETPTTGYRWEPTDATAAHFPVVGDKFDLGAGAGVGGGGRRRLSFRAGQEGTYPLRLELRQAWDRAAAPLEQFEVEVQVRS